MRVDLGASVSRAHSFESRHDTRLCEQQTLGREKGKKQSRETLRADAAQGSLRLCGAFTVCSGCPCGAPRLQIGPGLFVARLCGAVAMCMGVPGPVPTCASLLCSKLQ